MTDAPEERDAQTGRHVPVLLEETIELLRPRAGGRYVDGTLGGGGHAEAILEASAPDGELCGIDRDPDARAVSSERLRRFANRLTVREGSFAAIGEVLDTLGWGPVDGIVLDLGVSSFQLDRAERGFSFSRSGPLDMRMDPAAGKTAAEWIREAGEREIARVLREYGEEPQARRIAHAIAAAERRGELRDTLSLALVVSKVAGRAGHHHPATRTFQAVRIAVNGELRELERFLESAYRWLAPGGRLAILAYHSLEDRLVKQAFQLWARSCLCPRSAPVCRCGWSRKARIVTPRPLRPTAAEVERNPRSRSARLRAVERLAA